ncbi:MAG: STN domain-containing protein, partial [Comamonadaceae bacterium]|nr:STN domain-containing protein [Comamonadaceae bacterium]
MRPHSRFPRALLAAAVLAITSLHAAAQAAPFDIPAQPLPEALARFAAQSGAQLVYPPGLVQGRRSSAVQGTLDAEAALRQLLQGSGLELRRD